MKRLPGFDKYDYYLRSVQDVDFTLDFVERAYHSVYGREAQSFGEDFCGTFAMSCAWVERGPAKRGVAVDIDPDPIRYGMKHYFSRLSEDQQERLQVYESDARHPRLAKVEILAAMNYSFFIFKKREDLLQYFKNAFHRLSRKGLLALDCFGGIETNEPNVDEAKYRTFAYFWDQTSFDPITNEALFYIHYKRKGEKKREKVFRYDWRMWSVPELRDLLKEAGFKESYVYWEGENSRGNGNGIFSKTKHEKNCQAWHAYVTAAK
jgi:hypothetical protein